MTTLTRELRETYRPETGGKDKMKDTGHPFLLEDEPGDMEKRWPGLVKEPSYEFTYLPGMAGERTFIAKGGRLFKSRFDAMGNKYFVPLPGVYGEDPTERDMQAISEELLKLGNRR